MADLELQLQFEREGMTQAHQTSDLEALRFVNQPLNPAAPKTAAATKETKPIHRLPNYQADGGKLRRPERLAAIRKKIARTDNVWDIEYSDTEPPTKRSRSLESSNGDVRPTVKVLIKPATNICDEHAVQPMAKRRGRPRATNSQSAVNRERPGRQLRNRVIGNSSDVLPLDNQHQHHPPIPSTAVDTSLASPSETAHHATIEGSDAGDPQESDVGDSDASDDMEPPGDLVEQLRAEGINSDQDYNAEDDEASPAHTGDKEQPDTTAITQDPMEDRGTEENSERAVSDNEAESDESEPELEIFGQDRHWKDVVAASQRIGKSKNKAHRGEDLPELETKCIKELIQVIKDARQAYQSNIENDIRVAVAELRQKIADLSEASCEDSESQVITDIYAHAIPEFIKFLRTVLKVRTMKLRDKDDLAVLKEVIGVQRTLLILCTKARNWRAKPDTVLPIMQPTRQIKPMIASMHLGFSEELDRRRLRLKKKSNAARSSQEDSDQRDLQEREAIRRDIDARQQRIYEAATRQAQRLKQVLLISQPRRGALFERKEPVFASITEEWSKEQDKALLTILFKKELGARSAEERYLEALNHPLLQNLTPEHIAERARHFKPAMESALKDQGIPQWVQCIR
ncbi:MAG: hypothetical protein Q9218_003807 [Villophora microphyllina]